MSEPISLPTFDELALMAKNDPDKFNQLRHNLCQQFISECSQDMQPRLSAQQSHIERILQKAKNPTHANVLLSNELHKHIVKLSDALQGEPFEHQKNAQIIPFSTKDDWR